MRSNDIRKKLRSGEHAGRDTRHIHDLGLAIARERIHLNTRPRNPRRTRLDLLWDRNDVAYKVLTRTVATSRSSTTFSVGVVVEADYLLAVMLERRTYSLLEILKIPWPTVLWLGSVHDDRVHLRWSPSSPAYQVAERL